MNIIRTGRALVIAAALGLGSAASAKAQPFYPYPAPPPVQVLPPGYDPQPRPARWVYGVPAPRWVAPAPAYAPFYAGPHYVRGHWHALSGAWIPSHWAR